MYSREQCRQLLADYQRLALGARMPKREEVMTQKPPPASEASFTANSRLKADIDLALRTLPFEHTLIAFMVLSLGESNWSGGCATCDVQEFARHGNVAVITRTRVKPMNRFEWKQKVCRFWGLDYSEVSAITETAVEALYVWLNAEKTRGY